MAGVQLGPFLDIVKVHFGDGQEITHLSVDVSLGFSIFSNTNFVVFYDSSQTSQQAWENGTRSAPQINASAWGYSSTAAIETIPPTPYLIPAILYEYYKDVRFTDPTVSTIHAYTPGVDGANGTWKYIDSKPRSTGPVKQVGGLTKPGDQSLPPWQYQPFYASGSGDPEDAIEPAPVRDPPGTPSVEWRANVARWSSTGGVDLGIPHPAPEGAAHNFGAGTGVTLQGRCSSIPYHTNDQVNYFYGQDPITGLTTFSPFTDGIGIAKYYGVSPDVNWTVIAGSLNLSSLSLTYRTTVGGVPDTEATFDPVGFTTNTGQKVGQLTVLLKRSDL